MRRIIQTALVMLYVTAAAGQTYNDPPVEVEFDDLEPIWQMPIPNLSAEPTSTYEYYYSGVGLVVLDVADGVLTGVLPLQNDSSLYDGLTLVQLDVESGELLDHYGFNYLTDTLRVAPTGVYYYGDKIYCTGCAHINPDSITPIGLPYRACQHFVRVVDDNFDSHVDILNDEPDADFTRVSTDDLELLPISDGTYQLIRKRPFVEPMILTWTLDEELNFMSGPDTMYYDTPVPSDTNSVRIVMSSSQQDELECYYFFEDGVEYPIDAAIETYQYIAGKWEVVGKVDLTAASKAPHPATLSAFHWMRSGDVTVLSQVSFSEVPADPFASAWSTWIDNGDIISHVPDVGIDNHYYLRLQEIDLNADRLYAFAFPSRTGQDGFDVVKMTPDGLTELVGHMIVDQPDYRFVSNIKAQLVDDEVLIFGRVISSDGRQVLNLQAVKFTAEDLGITGLSTDVSKVAAVATRIKLYPTIADQEITVEVPVASLSAMIYDQQAQLVGQVTLQGGEQVIDVATYPPGHYVLQAVDPNTGDRYQAQFVVAE